MLALFYTNPGRTYYLRELSRLLECSVGSLRRELLKFQKDGLFLTERKGNLVFYSLNMGHPLYKEMRGRENPTSDIDVFIIGDASLMELSKVLRSVQKRLMREINPTLYARDEYLKRKAEGGGFIEDILTKPKIMLIGNGDDL